MTDLSYGADARKPDPALRSIDDKTAALFAKARALWGVSVGPECLPPDIEREARGAFRKLADYLTRKNRRAA